MDSLCHRKIVSQPWRESERGSGGGDASTSGLFSTQGVMKFYSELLETGSQVLEWGDFSKLSLSLNLSASRFQLSTGVLPVYLFFKTYHQVGIDSFQREKIRDELIYIWQYDIDGYFKLSIRGTFDNLC